MRHTFPGHRPNACLATRLYHSIAGKSYTQDTHTHTTVDLEYTLLSHDDSIAINTYTQDTHTIVDHRYTLLSPGAS